MVLFLRNIFLDGVYASIFAAAFVILFGFTLILPFQIVPTKLFSYLDVLIASVVSILAALVVTSEIFIRRTRAAKKNVGGLFLGSGGILSALVASIFGSATCALCLGAILGFFGAGTAFFIFQNRLYFAGAAILLLLLSLYFSAKRFGTTCKECGTS